ncbi:MAG TPA: MqnA/MqnD/SBP family protein [Thermodesulfobacteriota bacterium]|nr:MqnA/MqnD/SBP family protein [Thermodesulfobacteriota bacterium]
MSKLKMRLGHSPDADDAFMFYAMAKGKVDSPDVDFEHVIEDIQSLNQRALNKELEVTAMSVHAYTHVQDNYRILSCGASMGEGYGPIVVAKEKLDSLQGKTIAVPGKLTTAFLLLNIYAEGFIPVEMPFDKVMDAVVNGETDAALVIHEGQLTYKDFDLVMLFDLGILWEKDTSLPMPLGVNTISRDIDEPLAKEILRLHKDSIVYGLEHKDEALEYAMEYGRGMELSVGEEFVLMYVNDLTVDMGDKGRQALELLFSKAREKGIVTKDVKLDILEG